ncbi:hypothetical protein CK203_081447 [Vitis vinifera]|uniref:EF-hand domain-containing protein n=1 Tax=Vitis vinifera TaxID=29760 RepID=A0A438DYI6_VITVI|nr:hypothetical protein CK203_081447 [Vitis vinifera]
MCAVVPRGKITVLLTEEQIRGIFRKYDRNGDRRLSKAELKEAFKHLGSHFPWWRASRALSRADANKDGYISEEELTSLVNYALKFGYKV